MHVPPAEQNLFFAYFPVIILGMGGGGVQHQKSSFWCQKFVSMEAKKILLLFLLRPESHESKKNSIFLTRECEPGFTKYVYLIFKHQSMILFIQIISPPAMFIKLFILLKRTGQS